MITRLFWSAYLAHHLRGQASYPFRPLDAIRRDQGRRVREMVLYAYRYVPYYRETMDRLCLWPGDFRTADDLAKLPVIERGQLQRDPTYFVSTARPLSYYLQVRSGGSTGAPCTVYHNAEALFQNAAHGERERSIIARLAGRSLGYRETIITSPLSTAREVQEFCQRKAFLPRGARVKRQYLSLLDSPEENVALMNVFRPHVIHSYGSYLEVLFPYLRETAQPFHRPKVVWYSSDGLSTSVRRLITETFGIPVLSTYQAIEAFKIGFECDHHKGLHSNIDLYPLRIVDAAGESLPLGESGDVVVSNLVNRATVLLNYRLGDVISLLPTQCPCGRSLPVMSFPQGRTDDWIHLPSGKAVHPQAIRTIFTNEEQVWQYQVVQKRSAYFRVAIVTTETCDRQGILGRITTRFLSVFGQDVAVDVSFVDVIDPTEGGKIRPVISMRQGSQPGPVSREVANG